MLNYVWLALLFLGIGSAVTTDVINQNENKYMNGQPLPVVIQLPNNFKSNIDTTCEVSLKVNTQVFNKFYKEKFLGNITLKSKLTLRKKDKENLIYFNVDKTSPVIWQEMSTASGNKGKLTGKVFFDSLTPSNTAFAHIILESVSFIKIKEVTNSALDYAGTAVNISLGLIGIMALWLGIMKIAEEAGLILIIARLLKPLTKKLFPDVPPEHPAMGAMIMNMSANMLGLGNAATPFGLKAMEELNELNPQKDTATNAMCTFLAINTAGMTLVPATAIAVRAASGSTQPAIIIGTSLFASFCATVAGLTAAKILEKFPIKKYQFKNWVKDSQRLLYSLLIIFFLILIFLFSGGSNYFAPLLKLFNPELFKNIIQIFSIIAIPLLIVIFVGYGVVKKVRVYEVFVEGAKEGFNIAVKIIPYLVAMLVAIGIFRAGGAMDLLVYILRPLTSLIGMPAEALPMALMRPLSGSGSLGIMAEIMSVHGPDSFIGIMVSTFYGSTETTFYILAVYFGAVNIRKIRHALSAGLIADVAGILAAVFIVRFLFGY